MRPDLIHLSATDSMLQAATSSSFKVGVRANADSVDLLIHGVVGDSWEAMDSASVTTFLRDNRGKAVNVDINSPGGLAYDGIAIYNELVQHDAPVNVNITGMAGSAASIIAMAGDRIKIAENGQIFIHRAWGLAVGNEAVMLDMAGFLERLDQAIAATYAARTGRKASTMMDFMVGKLDGTTFTGQEAVDQRLADEVIPLKSRKDVTPPDGAGNASDHSPRNQFSAELAEREQKARQRQARALMVQAEAS